MPFISPAKLLVVLVVALIVLGPDKLPQVARQLGALWGDLRRFRSRLESDVRGAFPDLPPTHEVAQAVRSPLAFLDRLADEHEKSQAASDGVVDELAGAPLATGPPGLNGNGNGNGTHANGAHANGAGSATVEPRHHVPDVGAPHALELDDPSMN
jgi:sec-independent protein translocase protein TatB